MTKWLVVIALDAGCDNLFDLVIEKHYCPLDSLCSVWVLSASVEKTNCFGAGVEGVFIERAGLLWRVMNALCFWSTVLLTSAFTWAATCFKMGSDAYVMFAPFTCNLNLAFHIILAFPLKTCIVACEIKYIFKTRILILCSNMHYICNNGGWEDWEGIGSKAEVQGE